MESFSKQWFVCSRGAALDGRDTMFTESPGVKSSCVYKEHSFINTEQKKTEWGKQYVDPDTKGEISREQIWSGAQ